MRITAVIKSAVAVAALALGGAVVAPGTASAVTTDPFCDSARSAPTGTGWWAFVPSTVHRTGAVSQACYLRYGDRGEAVGQLKYHLAYCFGMKVGSSNVYDAATSNAIRHVQELYGLTVDGIYGPQTFKAMRWRLYASDTTNSEQCYRPFASRTVRANPPAGSHSPYCAESTSRYAGNGYWAPMPGLLTRTGALSFACYLKQGDLGGGVINLQEQLRYCYHSSVPRSGVYDSRTKATVAAVQRLHGITADGVYGPATMKAMYWRLYSNTGYSQRCYSPF